MNALNNMNTEELQVLYDCSGSLGNISSQFGISYSTTRAILLNKGVVFKPSCMSVYQDLRNTPFSDLHKKVIIASVLGDGHIEKPSKAKNPRFELSHCEKQKGYLTWIHDLLNPFSREIVLHSKAGSKLVCGNIVDASNFYRFKTVCHPDLLDIFNKYYRRGCKGVHSSLIDLFDIFMFSILFCDDGTVHMRNNEISWLSIASCSFSYEECEILVKAIYNVFDGNITIGSNGIIRLFGKKNCVDIINKIKRIVPKSIHYKLGSSTTTRKAPN